jgi:NAD(P)-dependent dehydrogenase (short-subunit alcohol dehydrogenase family)
MLQAVSRSFGGSCKLFGRSRYRLLPVRRHLSPRHRSEKDTIMTGLKDKVVLITGASSGIGEATVRELATTGARLFIGARRTERLKALAAEIGKGVMWRELDVTDAASFDAFAEAAHAEFGRIDALVNNAGVTKHVPHDDLDGLSAEDFQWIYGINTIGPYQMVRAARSLLEAGAKASGRSSAVVNVSSMAGLTGAGSSVAYAASKGALNSITLSLARALAPLIRVNTVCPGYIDTPWFTKGRGAEAAAKVREAVIAKVPLRIASTAEDIAGLICFLATSPSSNMTGELVRMDAGMHLQSTR